MWNAAYAFDDFRGNRAASKWTAARVRDLLPTGCPNDLETVMALAEVLWTQLADERAGREAVVQ